MPSIDGVITDLLEKVRSLDWEAEIADADDDAEADAEAEGTPVDDGTPPANAASIDALSAFIQRVEAQRGVRLSDAQADFLVAAAQVMVASLGGGDEESQ